MMSSVLYTELTPSEFRQRLAQAPIAYLPLGTLEWHGEHLPLGSDGLQAQGFFIRLAEEVGGVVLPPLFVGPDIYLETPQETYYGMDVAGFPPGESRQLTGSAYWVENDLFERLLDSILRQLTRAGFSIVVAHGHGPSTKYFRDKSAAWAQKYSLKLFHCWRQDGIDSKGIQVYTGSVAGLPLEIPHENKDDLGIQTDHAGANETSLMMALHPALVHMENLPANPGEWPMAVIGNDPRLFASPEKGWQAICIQAEHMATLLRAELGGLGK